jgi:hypothetical protein
MGTWLLGVAVLCTAATQEVDSTWNVRAFGAVADGVTDSTAAFQGALDAARDAKGGIVWVPTGQYSFDGTLTIPKNVTLRGVYASVPSTVGIRDHGEDKPEYGTTLMPRGGAGEEEGPPFIALSGNATLQGVTIWYPDQKPDADQPTPYPYAIQMRGNNPSVIDVQLLNPYNGIDASRNQRHLIRNVHGQPIHIGLYTHLIYDIGRIENVHWNPWWSYNTPIFEWQMQNGKGFVFGKTDWHYVLNTFCFGYNVGYEFQATEKGAANGNFLGIGADRCKTAIQVDQAAPMGILITNGEFVAFDPPEPTMLRVSKKNDGIVRFVNCAFWGPCDRIAVIEGTGTVGFSDCTFMHWSHHGEGRHAIRVEGGGVMIRGCEFKENKNQVYLGEGIDRAIVTENFIRGEERITNRAGERAVIRDNLSK